MYHTSHRQRGPVNGSMRGALVHDSTVTDSHSLETGSKIWRDRDVMIGEHGVPN